MFAVPRGTFRETVSARSGGSFPVVSPQNTSDNLTTSELIRECQHIILQFPIKQVADEQGAAPRTIEAQRNGESAISLRNVVNWCRRNPRVRAQFIRLLGGCGAETDPDFMQGLTLLLTSAGRCMSDAPACENPRDGTLPGVDGDGDDSAIPDLFGGT